MLNESSFDKAFLVLEESLKTYCINAPFNMEPLFYSHNIILKVLGPRFFSWDHLCLFKECFFIPFNQQTLLHFFVSKHLQMGVKNQEAMKRFFMIFFNINGEICADETREEFLKRKDLLKGFSDLVNALKVKNDFFYDADKEEMIKDLYAMQEMLKSFTTPWDEKKLRRFYKEEKTGTFLEESIFLKENSVKDLKPYFSLYDMIALYPINPQFLTCVEKLSVKHHEDALDFAFKLSIENPREILAYNIASLLDLESCLLKKEEKTLAFAKVCNFVAPKGLVSNWIEGDEHYSKAPQYHIEKHVLLDLLLGSADSHDGQYRLEKGRLYHLDYSRFLLPGITYRNNNKTFALICFSLMPLTPMFLSDSIKKAINSLDETLIFRQLEEMQENAVTYKAKAKLLETLFNDTFLLKSTQDKKVMQLIKKRYCTSFNSDFDLNEREVLLNKLSDLRQKGQKELFSKLAPQSVNVIKERIIKLKQYIKFTKEATWVGAFDCLYGQLRPFLNALKKFDANPYEAISYNKVGNRYVRRSLEDIIEESKGVLDDVSIQNMKKALSHIVLKSLKLKDLWPIMEIIDFN